MTRAKPWRQSGTVSWSVSSSSFGVLLFCKLEKEDIEVLLKSSKSSCISYVSLKSRLFAFLWGCRLGHWPAGWQAQTCDAICARRGGACGFAQTLCSFQFKQKMEKHGKNVKNEWKRCHAAIQNPHEWSEQVILEAKYGEPATVVRISVILRLWCSCHSSWPGIPLYTPLNGKPRRRVREVKGSSRSDVQKIPSNCKDLLAFLLVCFLGFLDSQNNFLARITIVWSNDFCWKFDGERNHDASKILLFSTA